MPAESPRPADARLRLFVGVGLDAGPADRIDRLRRHCRDPRACLRWVPVENLHLTLHFLGDQPAERVGLLREVLNRAAAAQPRIELVLTGWRWLPNPRRPRLLVLDGPAAPALDRFQRQLGEALAEIGCNLDSRRFLAHLSLARVRHPCADLALPPVVPIQLPIRAICLYRSRLLPDGARYRVLHRAALG